MGTNIINQNFLQFSMHSINAVARPMENVTVINLGLAMMNMMHYYE